MKPTPNGQVNCLQLLDQSVRQRPSKALSSDTVERVFNLTRVDTFQIGDNFIFEVTHLGHANSKFIWQCVEVVFGKNVSSNQSIGLQKKKSISILMGLNGERGERAPKGGAFEA